MIERLIWSSIFDAKVGKNEKFLHLALLYVVCGNVDANESQTDVKLMGKIDALSFLSWGKFFPAIASPKCYCLVMVFNKKVSYSRSLNVLITLALK